MWLIERGAQVPLWRADPARAILAFTTRHGGVSHAPYDTLNLGRSTADRPEAVEVNRRRVLETLALDPSHLATVGQVHGVTIVEAREPRLHPEADAVWTRVPGLAVAVTAADCVPLLLDAPGVVCAVHAGWRGTAAGLPGAAVRAVMDAIGGGAAEISVHVGPSIRACCYQVGPDVAGRFPEPARQRRGEGWHLDLIAAIQLQLRDYAIPEENIHVIDACTACDGDYFSHRRDAGLTGRQWALGALPSRAGNRIGARV